MTTETITHSIDAPGKARSMDNDPDSEVPAKVLSDTPVEDGGLF